MAMRPCERCLENRWGEFTHIDGWIRATCQNCGNEAEWKPWKNPSPPKIDKSDVKITRDGQPCRKCGTPVHRRCHKTPPKYKPGSYWFEYWFACPNKFCNTLYMVESAKRWFDSESRGVPAAYTSPPPANIPPVLDPRPDHIMPWD